jgi:formylglycine-generating enzyme required for sulfatase activity
VCWDDAQNYIAWLNKKLSIAPHDPTRYRLPSEAEWEYACRAGNQTMWCFGDDENQLKEYAWYVQNSGDQTHPVGQKKANTFGLYDTHGNVLEWVQDSYREGYIKARSDGSAWEMKRWPIVGQLGANRVVYRVLRGGSWTVDSISSCSTMRYLNPPDFRSNNIGFRLARTVP